MSSRLIASVSTVLPMLLLACQDQGITTLNKAPNVAITTPAQSQVLELGSNSPTFSAVIEDDSTETADLTIIWTLEGYGEISGDQTVTENGISLVVSDVLPVGNHTMTLKAIDDEGDFGSDTVSFSVQANPIPQLTLVSPEVDSRVALGDVVEVSLLVQDTNQSDLTEIGLTWGGLAASHPDAPAHPDSLGQADFFVLDLDIGTHTISVQAVDSLGGVATVSGYFDVVDPDADGDGFPSLEFGGDDCDDDDATVNPKAEELCNGVDDDCDEVFDEGAGDANTYYADSDLDGYGDAGNTLEACDTPAGYTTDTQDCDDTDAAVNPDGVEVCDSVDNDCDGTVDGADASDALTWYGDTDGDSYGDVDNTTLDCVEPSGFVADSADCDDAVNAVNPAAAEICDGIDNNCDGNVDDATSADAATWYADTDSDSHGDAASTLTACDQPSGYVSLSDDCDDTDGAVSPSGVEVCNSIDDNCDGVIDEDSAGDAATWYADTDSDGFGDIDASTAACAEPSGYVADSTDCDDSNVLVNPSGTELCNGLDDNCDGDTDEDAAADAATWYGDTDGDTYGDTDNSAVACDAPSGYVADDTDCDDGVSAVNPAATELCNGYDDNCDGVVDEDTAADASTWYADTDADGFGDATNTHAACAVSTGYVADSTDCDDGEATTNPGASEYCDGVDNNCDGTTDEDTAIDAGTWYLDSDSDGYGDPSASSVQCTAPSGFVAEGTDCDDAVSAVNPAATEYCDAIDNNCDGNVDESAAVDATTWYADTDGDVYGDASSPLVECYQPTDYVTDATDCDDTEITTYPGADEYCDGADNNCDGVTDEDTSLDARDWYPDVDSDGFGDMTGSAAISCYGGSGLIDDNTDCDDGEITTYPAADEWCDLVDNDCDGTVDNDTLDGDWYPSDADGDGMGAAGSSEWTCEGPDNDYDCDDTDPASPQVVDVLAISGSADGSIDTPWTRIQDGIDNAVSGGCVLVFDGTYFESLDFGGNAIQLSSVNGSASTILDASGSGAAALTLANGESGASITGITLTSGEGNLEETNTSTACTSTDTCIDYYATYCGGGLYIDGASATLSDVVIEDSTLPPAATTVSGLDTYYTYSYGGGICAMSASLTLSDTHILSNSADQGGALYLDASSDVEWTTSLVANNSATDGGAIQVDGGSLVVTNSVIANNEALAGDGGGLAVFDGSAVLANTTVALNLAGQGAGLYISGSSVVDVGNSILYGDGTSEGVMVDSGTYSQVYTNNTGFSTAFSGTTDVSGANGNIDSDPLFTNVTDDADYTNDDYTLAAGSPSIDAGNPNSAFYDADGTRNDQGAYGGPGSDW